MRWLIDGNNVMGCVPDGWWRDRRGAKRRLAAAIDAWQHTHGDPVVLVFDGREDRELTSREGFEVQWSGDGRRDGADDVIASLAADGEPSTVATSDQGLIARLPATSEHTGARRFRRLLNED